MVLFIDNEVHWKAKHEEVAKAAKVIEVKEEAGEEDELVLEGTPEQAEKTLKLLMISQKTCEALKKEVGMLSTLLTWYFGV